MGEPLISVVMPVYNGIPFLGQSIESVLNQTLRDFEFVILNDGSTDGSEKVIRSWAQRDERIRIVGSDRLGLVGSSNLVVAESRAAIIARMDADDLCEPERLRKQWEVMDQNPDVVAVGTLCDGIDASGRPIRSRDRSRILRHSKFAPFPHGSVMFRRSTFDTAGGYRVETEGFEDQDLFSRLMAFGRVVTLPEVLYHYRYHLQSASINIRTQNVTSIYSSGALRLWSGHKPEILRAIIHDRTSSWTIRKLMIAAWAAWGEIHASSLRSFSRVIVRMRDLLAGTRVSDGRFYEWRCR